MRVVRRKKTIEKAQTYILAGGRVLIEWSLRRSQLHRQHIEKIESQLKSEKLSYEKAACAARLAELSGGDGQ